MNEIPEYVDGLPAISGFENEIENATGRYEPFAKRESHIDFGRIKSAFACALHMQQPLVPAGGDDLQDAKIISYLEHMRNNEHVHDFHNWKTFRRCYKRMGELIPELVDAGHDPRIMLEYSGCMLYGLRQMGLDDVFENLERITCDDKYKRCVEWLGCPWGHAVAPSTPMQDYRLHVKAWQQHFAAIFGLDALSRVRGFSPSEMALPNHPDVCHEYIKILKECGYRWLLVQEHSVEDPQTGHGSKHVHFPNRLVATNSKGETVEIVALVKTQGSDTKLVAQMQPYHEAKGLGRQDFCNKSRPPLVSQIADGENGGVMMNEFPDGYRNAVRECSGSKTPMMNVGEYLDFFFDLGLGESDLPPVQPAMQKMIWDRFEKGAGPEKLQQTIDEIKKEDDSFHMEGGSWTNDRSWVRGYENVLKPMDKLSAKFSETVLEPDLPLDQTRVRNALFHLLTSQTSCYRYWGQGEFTDYAREICRRGMAILEHDF